MKIYDYIFTGSGLSCLLVLKGMSEEKFFFDKKILVIDSEVKNQNDRTWCFWDTNNRFENIAQHKWANIIFKAENFSEKININPYQYYKIESKTFYSTIKKEIQNKLNIEFITDYVVSIEEEERGVIITTSQEKYVAKQVFNSILFNQSYKTSTKTPLLQQHFIGWFIKTKKTFFDDKAATFMDFSVQQKENTRFMYVLPTSSHEALIEYTLFSPDLLADAEYETEIELYIKKLGITEFEIVEKEKGNIPMTCYPFWKENTEKVIQIGTAGGWTKACTGFTFKKTYKKSKELVTILKEKKSIKKLSFNKKFLFYDLLFIDVLFNNNAIGSKVFSMMFKNIKAQTILKFLDEETTWMEDLKIICSCPKLPFIKALLSRVFKKS